MNLQGNSKSRSKARCVFCKFESGSILTEVLAVREFLIHDGIHEGDARDVTGQFLLARAH